MESQSSRPEQQLNEYNDVSTVRAHMCGMPLKNFYTVCAEIRGTCHVGEKQKKLIAFAEAIKKLDRRPRHRRWPPMRRSLLVSRRTCGAPE